VVAIERGDELVALDGQPIARWIDRTARDESADTPYLAHAPMERDFPGLLWLEIGPAARFTVGVRRGAGPAVDVEACRQLIASRLRPPENMPIVRDGLLAVLVASSASGCSSEPMPASPDAGSPDQGPGQPGPARRLFWTDNGKQHEDDSFGMSRAILTNLSTVDFIIATGGSLDASMLFTVSAEDALTTGTYRCADENGPSLRYASMSYSLDQPLARLDDCTFTLTQVSSTSGAIIAGTFTARALLDTVHDISGHFSTPVQIMRAP
jgi:hypothetical protein